VKIERGEMGGGGIERERGGLRKEGRGGGGSEKKLI
jgi:hypothetical protein